ncbi:YoaK family protein [Allofournierella sp.]|uniref:YoaK family protein n=1 Tax=Allofournierella sp. TaxID=1940256 RepID=UPI003AB378C5
MKETQRATVQTSEALRVGLVLAAAGGYLDAYTYLCRGHVFANAETGNMVLLGVNLAAGQWAAALKYLPPILAFFAGVLVAEQMRSRGKARPEKSRLHWRQKALLGELGLLVAAAFAPLGGGWDMAVNVGVSFVCALQVESFRRVHGQAYATTMCTGNLRSGTELLYRYFCQRDPELLHRSLRYYGVIAAFIAGAAASALLAPPLGQWSVLVACGGLALALGMLFWEEVETRP